MVPLKGTTQLQNVVLLVFASAFPIATKIAYLLQGVSVVAGRLNDDFFGSLMLFHNQYLK